MQFYPIAEYRPDIANMNGLYCDDIANVFPGQDSYRPMKSFSLIPGYKFPDEIISVCYARSRRHGGVLIAGSKTRLYVSKESFGGSGYWRRWEDASGAQQKYNADLIKSPWSFTIFGTYVLAVNKNDVPQYLNLEASLLNFFPLPGNPPRAGVVKVWGDFLCLLQLPEFPNRIHWSGLNDIRCWTVGEKSCDYQDFPEGGCVQTANENVNPFIFMDNAIYGGTFLPGSDVVFSFKKLHFGRGCLSNSALSYNGEINFFVDSGGFFGMTNDGALSPIGFEKVDRTYLSGDLAKKRFFSTFDYVHNRIYWEVFDISGTKLILDTILVYDFLLQKWSVRETKEKHLVLSHPAFPVITVNGTASHIIAFDEENRFGSYAGENLPARISSADIITHGRTGYKLRAVRAIIDTHDYSVDIGFRNKEDKKDIYWLKGRRPSFRSGNIMQVSNGRYYRLKLHTDPGAAWQNMNGFFAEFSKK